MSIPFKLRVWFNRGRTQFFTSIKIQSTITSKLFCKNDFFFFVYSNPCIYNHVTFFRFNSKSATYSQVVWASTTMIGCGATKYGSGGFNRFFLVCNYAPGGNNEGEQVYKTTE